MKRNEIEAKAKELNLELSNELLDYIMDLNGSDINQYKLDLAASNAKYKTLKTETDSTITKLTADLDTANQSVTEIESLRSEVEGYKNKEINGQKKDFLNSQGFNGVDLIMDKIDFSKGTYDDKTKTFAGLDEVIEQAKKDYDYLLKGDESDSFPGGKQKDNFQNPSSYEDLRKL